MTEEIRAIRQQIIMQMVQRNSEYAESILKWCVTSLTALNGGTLVSIIGIDDLRKRFLADVVWIFGGGVISSVLSSFLFACAYSMAALEYSDMLWSNRILDQSSFRGLLANKSPGVISALLGFITAIVSCGLLIYGALHLIDPMASK